MITYILRAYTNLSADIDVEATQASEIMEAVDRVSPTFDIDFEAGERSTSFQFGKGRDETRAIGRATTALLEIPYVRRVTVTRTEAGA